MSTVKTKIIKNFRVKAFEKREIGDRHKKVYDAWLGSLPEAYSIANKIMQAISDVYGFSYVQILDADGDEIEVLHGPYDSDMSPDLSKIKPDT